MILLTMISTLHNDDWLPHSSDPFSPFGDMESEIAELKTLTKVTKLRQQIECRQEGSWMVVRDVPDNRSKSGTRKVTSYGRTSRSITRSVSSNVQDLNFDNFLLQKPNHHHRDINDHVNGSYDNEIVIEYPSDDEKPTDPSTVEIAEIIQLDDLTSQKDDIEDFKQNVPDKTSPVKKTSVVTLGKGNLVLIDDEDSNFQVTGISKGKVADAVSTLERVSNEKNAEKKVKKVGFSKTEVHFAPDSGRVNIVETDEKPPPSQMLRRKKRPKNPNRKSNLPKLYFGDEEQTNLEAEKVEVPKEHFFPVIREPSPLLSTVVASLTNEKLDVPKSFEESNKPDEFLSLGNVRSLDTSPEPTIFDSQDIKGDKDKNTMGYLGNVSPKLSKLLQNSMQHEFQLKQKQIMSKIKPEPVRPNQVAVNIKLGPEIEHKSITQVNLLEEPESDKTNPTKLDNLKLNEPLYINKDVVGKEKKPSKPVVEIDKAPKPKPRISVTKISVTTPKEVKPTKPINKSLERVPKRNPPKPKEPVKKEIQPVKPLKTYARTITPKQPEVCKRTKIRTIETATNGSYKLQKMIKNSSSTEKNSEVRTKKTKEPLRSFEKVSNGWVGHCIVPLKQTPKKTTSVTITTNVYTTSSASSQTQGSKRSIEPKALPRTTKTTFSSNKQFSLSKEHLKSAKLVKELSKENTVQETDKPEVPKPRVNVVRPHIIENKNTKTKSIVSRRRLQYEESYGRLRRDSEQSDDSVVRADEEVRAYMFHARHKVFFTGAGTNFWWKTRLLGLLYLIPDKNKQPNKQLNRQINFCLHCISPEWLLPNLTIFNGALIQSWCYIPAKCIYSAYKTLLHL